MIGGAMPARLVPLKLPESFTPCGFGGVPALFGVTFASRVTVASGACATDGATTTTPTARTAAPRATNFRMLNLLRRRCGRQGRPGRPGGHGSEAAARMQTTMFPKPWLAT